MFNREFRFCCLFVFALTAAFAGLSISAENTGPGVTGFLKTLEEGNPQQREQAIFDLSALYDENEELGGKKQEAIAALRRHLKDPNQIVRQWAACTVRKIEPSDKEAIPVLIEALTSEVGNPELREQVILAISGSNDNDELGARKQEVVAALRHRLKDDNHIVRQCAAYVLNKIESSDKEVIPVLIEALTERTDYATLAMGAIGSFGPEAAAAVPALAALLKDNWSGLDGNWALTLKRIGTPEAMEGSVN
ncbi:MAG: HEAT repeat domain-containing protein [Elusimicrobiota bacterium]